MRDILANIPQFLRPWRSLREAGSYPFYTQIDEMNRAYVTVRGQRLLMLGSSDYLGLSQHPKVMEAAAAAISRLGTSVSGPRCLNGTLHLHEQLEDELARFLRRDGAITFPSGYQANLGALVALPRPSDLVACDELVHASIVDATRLSAANTRYFGHNDFDDLSQLLEQQTDRTAALVVFEGLYSVDGDLCDLPRLSFTARRNRARTLIDEAHSVGTIGPTGRGVTEHFEDLDSADIIVGTFSKALAATGGFVAGPADVIELMRHRARSLIFSAALPPPCVASAREALRILSQEPELVEALASRTRHLMLGLRDSGYRVLGGTGPILILPFDDDTTALRFAKCLSDLGIFVNPIVYPAIPRGGSRIRISVTNHLTEDDLDFAIASFRTAASVVTCNDRERVVERQ